MTPVTLIDLLWPILAAWIAVHVFSTLAWTVLPHHKPEWKHLAMQGPVGEALNTAGAAPGEQFLLSTGESHDTDPGKCRGMVILWSHTPRMGANIGMTLGFFLFAAATIGYLATIGLHQESSSIDVFRFTATAGLLTHAAAGAPTIIWFRRKFLMDLVDGVVYALATGAAFTLLWPSA